jgi:hypothetical protein
MRVRQRADILLWCFVMSDSCELLDLIFKEVRALCQSALGRLALSCVILIDVLH